MTNCDRCGKESHGTIVSKFNTDSLCDDCHDDERLAPGYQAADAAELAACRRGDFNFEGVGLSTEDIAFLAKRRKGRGR